MEIQIILEKKDWWLFQSYIYQNFSNQRKRWIDNSIVWLIITIIFMSTMQYFSYFSYFHEPTAILVSINFILVFVLYGFKLSNIQKAYEPNMNGVFCGKHTFIFSETGISSTGEGYHGNHSWKIVKKIERSNGMIMIYFDTAYALVFVESKLDNPDEFFNNISNLYEITNK